RSFSWQNSFCVLPLLFHTSINENINCRVVMSVELSIALLFSSKTIPSASSLKYVLYRWVTAQRRPKYPDILDANVFFSIDQAQQSTDQWLEEYHSDREHEALGYQTPAAYAA